MRYTARRYSVSALCTVTVADPEREFAFSVAGLGGATANTWRYSLEPVLADAGAGGTDVTESFELPATLVNRLYWFLGGPARLRTDLDGMRATLERVKAVVERA
jgi:hypothetical protein